MTVARTLRIDLMSDLHVEGWSDERGRGPGEAHAPWTSFRPPGAPAEVAVIAGDAANGVERSAAVILEAAEHWPEVVVVDGNHEYHDTEARGQSLDAAYTQWRAALAAASNVHVLAPGAGWWDAARAVQWVGANGWYDFEAGPQGDVDSQFSLWWRRNLDARRIEFDGQGPRERAKAQAVALGEDVARASSDPKARSIVAVTHTQPSRKVLGAYADPRHPDAPANGAYVNVALEAVPGRDVEGKLRAWLYGHTHTPGRTTLGGVLYVTQPRGFRSDRETAGDAATRYRAARVMIAL